MNNSNELCVAGIMTGNSLDAADAVVVQFSETEMRDLVFKTCAYPQDLSAAFRLLRECIISEQGNLQNAESLFNSESVSKKLASNFFNEAAFKSSSAIELLHRYYLKTIQSVFEEIKNEFAEKFPDKKISLLGFHGQTCGHYPPSIANLEQRTQPYTCQFGSGQQLSDLLQVPIVYDFRSDDIFNGGEAAPLAPIHHAHIAEIVEAQGLFPIAFCNAGNSGNISIIYRDAEGKLQVRGWDTGPFNHFTDLLMRNEKQRAFDLDGQEAAKGSVDINLLRALFEKSVVTEASDNYLLKAAPKSSDPMWYREIPEMLAATSNISFKNRLRTVQYFSAYIFFHSLTFVPQELSTLKAFALAGGGWNNPLVMQHFKELLVGDYQQSPVLPEHQDLFANLSNKFSSANVMQSQSIGFEAQAMEARLFADAALCRIKNQCFALPEITGGKDEVVLGYLCYPQADPENCTDELRELIGLYGTQSNVTTLGFDPNSYWNRAVLGWRLY